MESRHPNHWSVHQLFMHPCRPRCLVRAFFVYPCVSPVGFSAQHLGCAPWVTALQTSQSRRAIREDTVILLPDTVNIDSLLPFPPSSPFSCTWYFQPDMYNLLQFYCSELLVN